MALSSPRADKGGYTAELDAQERASRDEIMALQTRRLAWSLIRNSRARIAQLASSDDPP